MKYSLFLLCLLIGFSFVVTVRAQTLVGADDNTNEQNGNAEVLSEEEVADWPRWFSDLGIGYRMGGALQSSPIDPTDFSTSFVNGPDILVSALSFEHHRLSLNAGFMAFSRTAEKGTSEIEVDTHYNRLEFSGGYSFLWKLLVVEARVGLSLTVVSVKTIYGKSTYEIVNNGNEPELVFKSDPKPEVKNDTGVNPGFLGGIGIGISPGELLFDIPGLLEVRAQSDYVRRNARNEITVGGLIVFWPTKLIKRK